jgi:alkaline phosphatase D
MAHGDNFGFLTIDWTASSPKISMQIRDVDGEITLKETFPLSLLQAGTLTAKADLPHTPGPGAISPRDALKKIGDKVVIEMKVQAVGGTEKRIFLNSEKNFRSELNFTIVVNAAATTGKYANAKPDTFKDKIIRVTGTVSEFKGTPQILVDDEKQLEVLD